MTRFEKIVDACVVIAATGLLATFLLWAIGVQAAPTAVQIQNGGTGTTTLPSYGQVLVGGKNGEYEYVSTSTFSGSGAGAVSSVFGRTGVVTAQSGDYTTSLVPEGSNLYYTSARALADFIANLAGTTSVASITTLSHLSLPYSQLTGMPLIASSTLLGDSNTFSGANTFTQTITGSITGNAGTVTNGVYTTTFGTLFDNRLSASSSISGITTLPNLSLPYTQVTGAPAAVGYPFTLTGNATSTLTQFNGGLTAYGTSTIGNGAQAGGLTISGGATTTGATLFQGNVVENSPGNASSLVIDGNSTSVASSFTLSDITTAGNTLGDLVNPSSTANTTLANIPLSATIQTGSGSTGGLVLFNKANAPIIFGTGGNAFANQRAVITGTGLFGIGTTTPYSLLSVGGQVVANNFVATTTGTSLADLTLSNITGSTQCLHVNSSGVVSGTNSDCGTGAGGVTSVTATYPIQSSAPTGAITLSTAFGTTSNNGVGNNVFLYNSNSGVLQGAASSSLSLPNTALQHSSVTVNGVSISLGSSGTVASTSLLGDTNTFSGTDKFSNAITIASLNGLVGANNGLTYAVSTSSLTASITGNAGTATALASNGTNCASGFFALGVDASGNAEGCTYVLATTSPWNADQFVYLNHTGVGVTAASSSFFGYIPLNPTRNVNTTFPLQGGGNLTADLTLTNAFSTTSNSGMSQGNLYVGTGGVLQTAASSSIFGYTPLNPTRQLTINGTVNQITSSVGAQDLSADRTWILSLPNHVIFPNDFLAILSSTTNATTTGSAYFTGVTASRLAYIDSTGKLASGGTGTSGNCVQWGANNTLADAGAVCGTGGGGVTSVSTTYPLQTTGASGAITLSTAFGTTSNWGIGANGVVVTSNGGVPFIAASSTLNLPNTALQFSSVTVNGVSIALGSSGTVASTSLLGDTNTFSGTDKFNNAITDASLNGLVGANSGLTYAVSTSSLNASITGSAGSVANAVTFNSSGGASAGSTYNGSGAVTVDYHTVGAQVAGNYATFGFDWTPLTNYAVNNNATSTPLWLKVGLNASSTLNADQVNIGSTTSGTLATSTNYGNWNTFGNASSSQVTDSGVQSCSGTSALNTTVAGKIICGSGYLTGNQSITLSGDVTGSGATAITTTIAANRVTYADIQTVAANRLLGNITSATGNVGEISTSTLFGTPTAGQILAFLNGQNSYVSTTTLNIGGNAGTATALAANGTNCSAGNYPLGVDASGDAEGCTLAAVGTVTSVTGTYPIQSTGGATPVISTAFTTTTVNGVGNNVFLYNSNSGVMQGAASSSFFGYTPLNPTRQLTLNGTANQITSSAGAQDLSADRTWTFSLPNHVKFPTDFEAFAGSTTNATTTGTFYFTNSSLSQRPLYVDSTGLVTSGGTGVSGNCVKWGANNTFGDAGSACGTGGSASAAGNTNDVQYNGGSSAFSGSDNFVFNGTYVGIGTTTAHWPLQIASSTVPQFTLSDATPGDVHWSFRNANGNFYISTSSDTSYATNTLETIAISTKGNVGIGTDPSAFQNYRLDVAGKITAPQFLSTGNEFDGTVGTMLRQDSGSDVYIANAGSANNGSNGTNVEIGVNAGSSLTSGSIGENTLIGYSAGNAITTGDQNVFIGHNDGKFLQTGTSNTFLGVDVGSIVAAFTDGNGNVFIGDGSGGAFGQTAGNANVYLGPNTGGTVNANESIAIGYTAGVTRSRELDIGRVLFASLPATSSSFALPTTAYNVGIATDSPYATFTVQNNYANGNAAIFDLASSTSSTGATAINLFSVSNTGLASTTNLIISGIGSGSTKCLHADAAGNVSEAAADCGSGGGSVGNWFTPTNNFGVNTNATSTPISLLAGLDASSTITFGNAGQPAFTWNASNGRLGLGTSSPPEALTTAVATGGFATNAFFSGTTEGYFFAYDGTPEVSMGSKTNAQLNFKVNNATQGDFDTNGNFNIQANTASNHTWFTEDAPNANPQESTFTERLALNGNTANDQFIDWTLENYGTDNQASINISKTGASSTVPLSIRFWNSDLGNIAANGIYAQTWLPNGTIGFEVSTSTAGATAGGANTLLYAASSTAPNLLKLDAAAGTTMFDVLGTGKVGIGTTTPWWLFDDATSSIGSLFKGGQFALTDTNAGPNLKHWVFSSEAGNFYISTSSDAGATSTNPALSLIPNSLSQIIVGATSSIAAFPATTVAAFLNEPTGNGTNASTTMVLSDTSTSTSRTQIQMTDDAGNIKCLFVHSGSLVVQAGACN